ncbi:MAG: hypothetical protein P4M11_14750 [Candidatus Pacebacteria bacterium]|nr:hypothetical protein [Candidatus Paceibacterota bacterium]
MKDKMSSPVYMYYQLENYHQNHRIYMKSYVLSQLEGDDLSVSSLSDCDPIEHMYEVGIAFCRRYLRLLDEPRRRVL